MPALWIPNPACIVLCRIFCTLAVSSAGILSHLPGIRSWRIQQIRSFIALLCSLGPWSPGPGSTDRQYKQKKKILNQTFYWLPVEARVPHITQSWLKVKVHCQFIELLYLNMIYITQISLVPNVQSSNLQYICQTGQLPLLLRVRPSL